MLRIIEDTFKISKSSIDAHRHERKPLTCAEISKLSLFYQREVLLQTSFETTSSLKSQVSTQNKCLS